MDSITAAKEMDDRSRRKNAKSLTHIKPPGLKNISKQRCKLKQTYNIMENHFHQTKKVKTFTQKDDKLSNN
jgi:hypothetical protein